MSPSALTLDLAGLRCQIDLAEPAWHSPLLERYGAFLSQESASWQVGLRPAADWQPPAQPQARYDGPLTRLHLADLRGWIDLARRSAWIEVPDSARVPSVADRVLAYIVVQAFPREHDGLLLHAAGIELAGQGHVFCGPSGAGKTTVARLAAGHTGVLCDENIIVRLEKGAAWLYSTPFWGHSTPPEMIRRIKRRLPLRAVYILQQAPAFGLSRLTPGQAAAALLSTEKVAVERVESAAAWLGMAERLIARVPVYRLNFLPTTALWLFLRNTH